MAKGDKKKMQNQANTQIGLQQQTLDPIKAAAQQQTGERNDYYNQAVGRQTKDYEDMMGMYKDLYAQGVGKNQPGLERVGYDRSKEMDEAFGGYRNFMETGGFSPEDIRDMRARGISPIRAAYGNALNAMERQKNLAGGYSPNAGALRAKMASSQGQQMADAAQNVNAELARQVQQGKQFGTTGMGNLSVSDTGFRQQAQLANQQAGLEAARYNLMDPRYNALSGMAQLYGAAPGQAQMFGDQTDRSMGNWLAASGQQQGIGNNAMGYQQQVANTPSNFEVGFGRVGQGIKMAGDAASAWMGVPGLPKPKVPTNPRNLTGVGGYMNTGLGGFGS